VPDNWKLKGDFVMSCSCTVFCPCVISLGQHEPTEGYCQTWAGIRIEEGHHEETDLAGINVGLLIEIPGPLARGMAARLPSIKRPLASNSPTAVC